MVMYKGVVESKRETMQQSGTPSMVHHARIVTFKQLKRMMVELQFNDL
jgi:hypothetical protein